MMAAIAGRCSTGTSARAAPPARMTALNKPRPAHPLRSSLTDYPVSAERPGSR
jgi:hypothetical protein